MSSMWCCGYKISFEGTMAEKKMMRKLLELMIGDDYDMNELSEENERVLHIEEIGESIPEYGDALVGKLDDSGKPDYDLELAPKLFAALFPGTSFSYWISYDYSGSQEEEFYCYADYDGKKLKLLEYDGDNDGQKVFEDILEMKIISEEETQALKEEFGELFQQYSDINADSNTHDQNGFNHDKWELYYENGYELIDAVCKLKGFEWWNEMIYALYPAQEVLPCKDDEYIKSFFRDGDILMYLNEE